MAAKKKAVRKAHATLDVFKQKLVDGEYESVGGAKKGASYLPEEDRAKALKLVADKFGDDSAPAEQPKRGRGRPRKNPVEAAPVAAPKRRGRPPGSKNKASSDEAKAAPAPVAAPKKRGRPRKNPVAETAEAAPAQAPAIQITPEDKILAKLGFGPAIITTVNKALVGIELAQKLAGGTLEIKSSLQRSVDVLAESVGSVARKIQSSEEPVNHKALNVAAKIAALDSTPPPEDQLS